MSHVIFLCYCIKIIKSHFKAGVHLHKICTVLPSPPAPQVLDSASEKHLISWRRSCLLHLENAEWNELFLGVITTQLSCSCFILRHLSLGCRLEIEDWIKCIQYLVWFIMTTPIFWSESAWTHRSPENTELFRETAALSSFHLNLGKVALAEWSSNLTQC